MTREQLIDLARELLGTDDDLEMAMRTLGLDTDVVGRSANYDDYLDNLSFLKQVRRDLLRVTRVYQCSDSGRWRRRRPQPY